MLLGSNFSVSILSLGVLPGVASNGPSRNALAASSYTLRLCEFCVSASFTVGVPDS